MVRRTTWGLMAFLLCVGLTFTVAGADRQGIDAASSDGWVTIFADDFEGLFPGQWDVGDGLPGYGLYRWAKSTCRPYAGEHSAWAVGGGTDGELLACGSEYPDRAYAYMVYGPFSLAGASAAEMTFQLWLYSEPDNDSVFYGYSTDGQYYRGPPQLSESTNGWMPVSLDLGPALGEDQVWVTFIFLSDESIQYPEGCYVDDVLLRKQVDSGAATATPTATHTATLTATPTATATATQTMPAATATPTATEPPPGDLTLHGVVFHGDLGLTVTIADATVAVEMCVPRTFQTTTLADGSYELLLPAQYLNQCVEVTLAARAEDYDPYEFTWSVAELRAQPEQNIPLWPHVEPPPGLVAFLPVVIQQMR